MQQYNLDPTGLVLEESDIPWNYISYPELTLHTAFNAYGKETHSFLTGADFLEVMPKCISYLLIKMAQTNTYPLQPANYNGSYWIQSKVTVNRQGPWLFCELTDRLCTIFSRD